MEDNGLIERVGRDIYLKKFVMYFKIRSYIDEEAIHNNVSCIIFNGVSIS